ncbi:hypothetical protein E3P92_02295 [Wallemia ichthyophaga]|uniref:Thioredoxin domain-containing protein n=2 Tax=Wallemia ichthyophaga TaxID=245174 RepID=A0A4T0HAJ0_WALIC|nr:Peptide-N(4)-(N-acetyl-beta-glucosaminyl)asparagine amidase [Wallemia ichthyophaga EXF-994]TIA72380.1 hypothetical protein E3P91_02046 [Wallemia ichthyophaga]EOR01907.1 Peptide-N(4)-(N-acetyl-beta-glucosaminyl)asparagine amidase [Wallemia ichthyophaga EXF-994]TIA81790.1 hypothetical protein E3P98_01850 [Wallemia ichthyophaga]TIB00240.1 hypothetical protein E3P95_01786 [Wallemia ichthyophaga]TIB01367.1 hypothetical protein E3P94_01798 [Wallemia ichthyophaga]
MIELHSLGDLNQLQAGKLSVIDFYADWCGPCVTIAPRYEALSKQFPSVNFFKCNTDTAKDVAAKYRISAMPTFIFLIGDKVLETIKGANAAAIEAALKKYSKEHSKGSAFSGKGQTLGGKPAAKSNGSSSSEFNSHLLIGIALLSVYAGLWYYNM